MAHISKPPFFLGNTASEISLLEHGMEWARSDYNKICPLA